MAKAQRMLEGVTTVDEPEPVRVTRPAALLSACAPIFLRSAYIEQERGREKKRYEIRVKKISTRRKLSLTNPVKECTEVALNKALVNVVGPGQTLAKSSAGVPSCGKRIIQVCILCLPYP
jgi:hypothetical protein